MSTIRVNTIQNTSGVEQYLARAWVNFNGLGTVSIRASGNVSSITDFGVGDYIVNFTNAMADANYCVQTTAENVDCASGVTSYAAGSVRVWQFLSDTNVFTDAVFFNVTIFR